MRKMYSENQVKEIIKELLAITNGMGVVRTMDAPASTTLTDEQLALIRGGIFINGAFLGYSNPILLPAISDGSNFRGILLTDSSINLYLINKTAKVINVQGPTVRGLVLNSIYSINARVVPDFPDTDGKTYFLKYVNGVLTWVEDVV